MGRSVNGFMRWKFSLYKRHAKRWPQFGNRDKAVRGIHLPRTRTEWHERDTEPDETTRQVFVV